MREWLSRPEWSYLVAFLCDSHDDAMQSLMAADPNDRAAVARAQTEVKFLRFFTHGEVAEALMTELRRPLRAGQARTNPNQPEHD